MPNPQQPTDPVIASMLQNSQQDSTFNNMLPYAGIPAILAMLAAQKKGKLFNLMTGQEITDPELARSQRTPMDISTWDPQTGAIYPEGTSRTERGRFVDPEGNLVRPHQMPVGQDYVYRRWNSDLGKFEIITELGDIVDIAEPKANISSIPDINSGKKGVPLTPEVKKMLGIRDPYDLKWHERLPSYRVPTASGDITFEGKVSGPGAGDPNIKAGRGEFAPNVEIDYDAIDEPEILKQLSKGDMEALNRARGISELVDIHIVPETGARVMIVPEEISENRNLKKVLDSIFDEDIGYGKAIRLMEKGYSKDLVSKMLLEHSRRTSQLYGEDVRVGYEQSGTVSGRAESQTKKDISTGTDVAPTKTLSSQELGGQELRIRTQKLNDVTYRKARADAWEEVLELNADAMKAEEAAGLKPSRVIDSPIMHHEKLTNASFSKADKIKILLDAKGEMSGSTNTPYENDIKKLQQKAVNKTAAADAGVKSDTANVEAQKRQTINTQTNAGGSPLAGRVPKPKVSADTPAPDLDPVAATIEKGTNMNAVEHDYQRVLSGDMSPEEFERKFGKAPSQGGYSVGDIDAFNENHNFPKTRTKKEAGSIISKIAREKVPVSELKSTAPKVSTGAGMDTASVVVNVDADQDKLVDDLYEKYQDDEVVRLEREVELDSQGDRLNYIEHRMDEIYNKRGGIRSSFTGEEIREYDRLNAEWMKINDEIKGIDPEFAVEYEGLKGKTFDDLKSAIDDGTFTTLFELGDTEASLMESGPTSRWDHFESAVHKINPDLSEHEVQELFERQYDKVNLQPGAASDRPTKQGTLFSDSSVVHGPEDSGLSSKVDKTPVESQISELQQGNTYEVELGLQEDPDSVLHEENVPESKPTLESESKPASQGGSPGQNLELDEVVKPVEEVDDVGATEDAPEEPPKKKSKRFSAIGDQPLVKELKEKLKSGKLTPEEYVTRMNNIRENLRDKYDWHYTAMEGVDVTDPSDPLHGTQVERQTHHPIGSFDESFDRLIKEGVNPSVLASVSEEVHKPAKPSLKKRVKDAAWSAATGSFIDNTPGLRGDGKLKAFGRGTLKAGYHMNNPWLMLLDAGKLGFQNPFDKEAALSLNIQEIRSNPMILADVAESLNEQGKIDFHERDIHELRESIHHYSVAARSGSSTAIKDAKSRFTEAFTHIFKSDDYQWDELVSFYSAKPASEENMAERFGSWVGESWMGEAGDILDKYTLGILNPANTPIIQESFGTGPGTGDTIHNRVKEYEIPSARQDKINNGEMSDIEAVPLYDDSVWIALTPEFLNSPEGASYLTAYRSIHEDHKVGDTIWLNIASENKLIAISLPTSSPDLAERARVESEVGGVGDYETVDIYVSPRLNTWNPQTGTGYSERPDTGDASITKGSEGDIAVWVGDGPSNPEDFHQRGDYVDLADVPDQILTQEYTTPERDLEKIRSYEEDRESEEYIRSLKTSPDFEELARQRQRMSQRVGPSGIPTYKVPNQLTMFSVQADPGVLFDNQVLQSPTGSPPLPMTGLPGFNLTGIPEQAMPSVPPVLDPQDTPWTFEEQIKDLMSPFTLFGSGLGGN